MKKPEKENNTSGGLRILLKTVELFMASCRLRIDSHPESRDIVQKRRQFVIAIWHSSLVYILYHFRKHPAAIMVSGSKDGEWAARALRIWGQHPVRGSRLKGGLAALRDMTRLLKDRHLSAGIVADGSTGPACIAQKGAVILARDTGFPIIPTGFAAEPAFYFRSWDKMVLPLPFSRIAIVYGIPISVPENTRGRKIEDFRLLLEEELNRGTARAKRLVKSKCHG